jgi:hypothetical protein
MAGSDDINLKLLFDACSLFFRNQDTLYPIFFLDEFAEGRIKKLRYGKEILGNKDSHLPLPHSNGKLSLPGQFHRGYTVKNGT